MAKIPLTVRIEEEDHKRLSVFAARTRRSISNLLVAEAVAAADREGVPAVVLPGTAPVSS